MQSLKFSELWNNHPYPSTPCNTALFENQCAIRMGVALEKSGVDTSGFDKQYPNRRCYDGFKHEPKHILPAMELAIWMSSVPKIFGKKSIIYSNKGTKLSGKKGILFILNGFNNLNHIDLWDGNALKEGTVDWINCGDEIWFWEIHQ